MWGKQWSIMACAIACMAPCGWAQDNAVRNPGFESLAASGGTESWSAPKPGYRFADGAGRNGSRGLVFDNEDPHFYSFPTQPLHVQPGRCYAFEVWVRTENLQGDESGATICMEWSGPDGKWLGGAYAEGVRGTSDGWRKVCGTTRAIPTNAVRITVAPYVRRGMTGKAWFDDLKVTAYVPPLVCSVASSLYRNTVAQGRVELFAGLALNEAGVRVGEVSGAFDVIDASGKTVRSLRPEAFDGDCARVSVDAAELPMGDSTVRFSLTSLDGVPRGSAELCFHRVTQLPARRVFVDRHRRLIVDGQPFFPLGMYWSGVKEPELATYAQGPFNCLMPYGSPNQAQLDACQARGLKVIYSIKDLYSGTRWAPSGIKTEADEAAEIRKRVALYREHPALLAWYTNDELPVEMAPRLRARQRLLEELDPDHPTWAVLYQYDQVRAYLQTFDVIGTDPYPIPEKPAGLALEWTRVTRDQSYGSRAVWQVPQAFDWGAYRKGAEREKTRAPTPEELRSMAWQCVAAGANGLVFYSFFDLYKMTDRDPFEKRWGEVCAVASEVKRYIPVLLSDEAAPALKLEGSRAVEARAWRVGRDVYVLAVNSSSAPATAAVTLSDGPASECQTEFGTAPAVAANGALSFAFGSLESVLIRLRR